MNWPGLGNFKISGTKKTKLLRILEKMRFCGTRMPVVYPIAFSALHVRVCFLLLRCEELRSKTRLSGSYGTQQVMS